MATLKQIDANRRNALKSTGPRTSDGKAAASLNSLRHGLRARTVILPGEDPEEFIQLCADLEAEWRPQSRTEQFYLEQVAVSQWKLTRMEAAEASVCGQSLSAKEKLPLLDRLWQTQSRMERSYARAQRELERLQSTRTHDAENPAEIEIAHTATEPSLSTTTAPSVSEGAASMAPDPHVQLNKS